VTVTDANGCSDTTSATISVSNVTASVSASSTICAGQTASLTASGGTTYSWSSGATTSSINVSPSTTTNYSVIVANASGCPDTAATTVTVSAPPVASASGNTTICSGENASLTASGGGNYLWNPTGQSTSSITVNPASTTTYSVIVSIGSCTDTATATVIVNPGPTATAGTDITINIGSSTTLTGSGGGTYSWSPSTGLSCSNCQTPVANPTVTTNYCLYVSDANGCDDSSCVTVTVVDNLCKPIYLPNAFSPNGDLEDDTLFVYGTCIKEMKLIIYNRWGQKVFESNSQPEGWDGMYKGKLEDSAVFAYYLTYTLDDGTAGKKQGNISLVR
jgi:gliding motility-associated-like protein